ncbi:glucose 1-dehydrogenase [Peribacillus muralis]|uniref:SDR family NAD(P)-dependent oxidoreductase n=1 Tax=Peribacillus muralis TaxID=264697 RepID=UPI000AACB280|nr:glucose 1-dehydrogenase [Peribacillus muralis]
MNTYSKKCGIRKNLLDEVKLGDRLELNQLFNLNGKVAIITGASKGIGKDLAIMLARAGSDIAIIARNEEQLEEAAHEIERVGVKVLPVSFDLTKVEDTAHVMERIYKHFGRIDILINNAGINVAKPAEELTPQDWDKVLDINLKSVFFTSQAAGKYMIDQKKGKIINMSSQMAFVGYYKRAAYSSSKGGITQMTKALAIEWAPHQINVNAIAPTFIETPMTKQMFEDETFKREVLGRIPLGRLAKTEDLFGGVLYLASSSSDMMTGQTLVVDGGWTVW